MRGYNCYIPWQTNYILHGYQIRINGGEKRTCRNVKDRRQIEKKTNVLHTILVNVQHIYSWKIVETITNLQDHNLYPYMRPAAPTSSALFQMFLNISTYIHTQLFIMEHNHTYNEPHVVKFVRRLNCSSVQFDV